MTSPLPLARALRLGCLLLLAAPTGCALSPQPEEIASYRGRGSFRHESSGSSGPAWSVASRGTLAIMKYDGRTVELPATGADGTFHYREITHEDGSPEFVFTLDGGQTVTWTGCIVETDGTRHELTDPGVYRIDSQGRLDGPRT